MWIPDPRFEEPNLLIKKTKPIGAMVVDWSNPITKDLKICLAPQSSTFSNLAGNEVHQSNQQIRTLPTGERAYSYNLYDFASPQYDPFITDVVTESGGHTCLAAIYARFGAKMVVVSSRVTQNKGFAFASNQFTGDDDNRGLRFFLTYGGVASYASSSFVQVSGVRHAAVVGFSGTINSDYDYIINGEYDSNISVGTMKLCGDPVSCFGEPVFSEGSAQSFVWLYYWNRRLSRQELKSVSDHPYQFLIPA
jgi:hypothetical protein